MLIEKGGSGVGASERPGAHLVVLQKYNTTYSML